MARQQAVNPVRLADYVPPAYLVERTELRFSLFEERTRVVSRMLLRRNPAGDEGELCLYGRNLELVRILLNGRKLSASAYTLDEESLRLATPGERFELEVETLIYPHQNSSLEGLYKSAGTYCTQCEAEGFRQITYYPDRPDVLARFTTVIEADREQYPVLLSNGNLVESGELENGRHFVRWEDPFPKPSYLFALVAGQLAHMEDEFVTCSGRQVRLRIYVEPHNLDKCAHALQSLQRALRWDEERFGREYDLDIYMIVAVDDFNMGAMENKGLNIFNSKYVLARPESATDTDFINIESVVGHEYFHNWSGNRVTCRDWFQLTLKEGLTVFRDQEFTADLHSRAVKRIEDVRVLRRHQFSEDAGPMAHAIQPESYLEINNFYTPTVYNKGAEVIRMAHTLLGEKGFRRGLDLYFATHDGEAVTTEDFVRALEDATGVQLQQFRRWYSQVGTPRLAIRTRFEKDAGCFHVTLRQLPSGSSDDDEDLPLHLPVRLALLDSAGAELPLQLEGEPAPGDRTRVLEVRGREHTFRFSGLNSAPVLSVLRGFSAPVELEFERGPDELAFLMAHDGDPYNRWDAGQKLATKLMVGALAPPATESAAAQKLFVQSLSKTLQNPKLDPALVALTLALPDEAELAGQQERIDVEGAHKARAALEARLAEELREELRAAFERAASVEQPAMRSLANACLEKLVLVDSYSRSIALERVQHSRNMTVQVGALSALVLAGAAEAEEAIAAFAEIWSGEPLVMDKWFAVQARAPFANTVERVSALLGHPEFDLFNPNRARALLGAFAEGNPYSFHEPDGRGYRLLATQVARLDGANPSTAARLVSPLTRWHRYDRGRRVLMRAELNRIAELEPLSRNLYEMVSKSLEKPAVGRQA